MSGAARIYPLRDRQRDAVDPNETVWLSASAGTGKTQVLSTRVLRLLLQEDVEPSQILCLTFTRAGAAEMATRVNEALAGWVRASDNALFLELEAIGAPSHPEARARARTRFAAVLDCPGGGLRIETIHAFAQWLLSAFPIEAGLTPGSRPMEDRDQALLMREVLAQMLFDAEAAGDATLLDALAQLSLRSDRGGIERFLLACAGSAEAWAGPGAWQPPLRPRVNRLLGLAADECAQHLHALCDDGQFDCQSLLRCLHAQKRWGTKTGDRIAEAISAWLACDAAGRVDTIDALQSALFTKDGRPQRLDSMEKIAPGYADHAARVGAAIIAVKERKALAGLTEWLTPALTLGRAFALRWAEAKAREGLIDFDDQIRRAAELLQSSDMAGWIRYKLDRQFDHILIDEAQDTNEAQWRVIDALTDEFFAGEGARGDRLRTLFVVGDYKQAIFRFQGTSPKNFEAARRRVRERMALAAANEAERRGGRSLRELQEYGLGRSYRTAQPVLDFVDEAIASIGHGNFGLDSPPEPHRGEERPGQVVMWRAVGGSGDADDEPGDAGSMDDEGEESWLSRPDRRVANNIARQVRAWLDHGFPLVKGQARRAGPGDVMVLVRKRKELAGLIVARLHAAGVPVAGIDRLRLGAPLAVRDLMAALRFAAQPRDDLNLAALLVSPLIGWSQEVLLEHGYRGRGVALWDHLRGATAAQPRAAVEQLVQLLSRADFQPPQHLLQWLLVGSWQGRRKLVARLGREANDPIDELLNAALAFAASHTPGLHSFIRWFDAGEGDLKRDAGQEGGLVRVMTVHGSKGLQAPIVILADAADDPDKSLPNGLQLTEPGSASQGFTPRTIPLPVLRKSEKLGRIAEAEERNRREEREEHWRLLYVAMTRAEEALFIAGALPARSEDPPADSWYARLAPLFDFDSWRDDPIWAGRLEWGTAPAELPEKPKAPATAQRPALPEWLTAPIGEEPRPPRPLAPSALGEEQAPDPPLPGGSEGDAARRGVLIHRLLERLPELAPERREDTGRQWLARQAADLDTGAREEMLQAALAVLADERFADVFAPDALAEVPVTATVGGTVIAGTIDRLRIDRDTVRIVDFKTARRPPESLDAIPQAYWRQMAAYAAALEVIYPDRRVEAALLYTATPRLFVLPGDRLSVHKQRLGMGEESF